MEEPKRRRFVRRRLQGGKTRRRVMIVTGGTLAFLLLLAGTAFADFSTGTPGVTITAGGPNCNGIIPTPAESNTSKTLIGGTLVPGGTAMYRIAYPVDPTNFGDWTINDCVLMGTGTDLKTYTVVDEATFTGVNNNTAFVLDFTVTIPATALTGTRVCNVAKTINGPSAAQQSVRKAGPACFIIGGDARVEKHSTTDPTGAPIPGATFAIGNCVNTAEDATIQPLIINGVSFASTAAAPYAGHGTISILATTGVITFAAPVGSHCDVTETAAPPGYGLPADVTQTVTITSAVEATVVSFLDPPAPGSVHITKVAPASESSTVFTFSIDCTNPTASYPATITGSGSTVVNNIPAGSHCTVLETGLPTRFETPVIEPSTFTVNSEQAVLVTVTNALKPGSLRITKSSPTGTSFTFDIACTSTVAGNNNYVLSVPANGQATQDGIPAGSVCTVTERVPDTFGTPVYSPSNVVTILPGATVTVSVVNALLPGNLSISKVAPAGSPSSFTFDVACINPTGSYTLTVPANGSATQSGIPAGSVCTVTERVPTGFAQPTYTPGQTVTILPGATVSVSVTNTLLPLGITVVKTATPTSGVPGGAVTYTYVVTNTGQVRLVNVSVDDDKLGHIGDIAVLEPGQSVTLTKATTLPTVAGLLTNVATVVGHDSFGRTTTATDNATVTVVLGVKVLARTGASVGQLLAVALGLLGMGLMLRRAPKLRSLPVASTSVEARRIVSRATVASLRRPFRRSPRPPDRAGP